MLSPLIKSKSSSQLRRSILDDIELQRALEWVVGDWAPFRFRRYAIDVVDE